MRWEKKGLIFKPTGKLDWSISHAQVPVPDYIEDQNIIRIYYSTRDAKNRSSISYIEVDADNPQKVLFVLDKPILTAGAIGTFDDCGVMPSWIIDNDEKKFLYYIGWNVRNTVPYYNSVGLAISRDHGKNFIRFSEGPLWDRNYIEPYFSASSCVLKEGTLWRNWYLSCTGYKIVNDLVEPRYHLKYAESDDGINWRRSGRIAIDFASENEAGIVKASVIKIDDKYNMWFAHRNFDNYRTDPQNSYKIGFAESLDGLEWTRRDEEAGISISVEGWDSEMITYPHVLWVKGKLLMFYNGNGFGRTGFGYAVAQF